MEVIYSFLRKFEYKPPIMSLASEIKCPHCGAWSQSTGMVDAKCPACGKYLEPELLLHEKEKKIVDDTNREKDFYVLKDSDETIVQLYKMFVNSFRLGSYYTILLFFIFISVLLVAFGLLAA